MNRNYLPILIILLCATYSLPGYAEKKNISLEIYEKRYISQKCPPEYPGNLDYMIKLVEFGHTGTKMRRLFGDMAPKTMRDVTVLQDRTDASACQHFSQLYDKLINKPARLFEGGEAEYWHDLTYYQSDEFYFVVIGGGFLIQEDPNQPGKERIATSSVSGVEIFFKHSLEPVHFHLMEDPAD